jgi:glycosyltransferase involved in cell wall biosynthesis
VGAVGRQQLESILLTTNVFAFPTLYEGFGLALSEAMASGHACVGSDIPVVREVLGDCGVYAPARDAGAFVDELARLVRDPDRVEQLAARAHERAASFSWEDAGIALDQIIRDTIIEDRRGSLASSAGAAR